MFYYALILFSLINFFFEFFYYYLENEEKERYNQLKQAIELNYEDSLKDLNINSNIMIMENCRKNKLMKLSDEKNFRNINNDLFKGLRKILVLEN
jgi:hypothetical protein